MSRQPRGFPPSSPALEGGMGDLRSTEEKYFGIPRDGILGRGVPLPFPNGDLLIGVDGKRGIGRATGLGPMEERGRGMFPMVMDEGYGRGEFGGKQLVATDALVRGADLEPSRRGYKGEKDAHFGPDERYDRNREQKRGMIHGEHVRGTEFKNDRRGSMPVERMETTTVEQSRRHEDVGRGMAERGREKTVVKRPVGEDASQVSDPRWNVDRERNGGWVRRKGSSPQSHSSVRERGTSERQNHYDTHSYEGEFEHKGGNGRTGRTYTSPSRWPDVNEDVRGSSHRKDLVSSQSSRSQSPRRNSNTSRSFSGTVRVDTTDSLPWKAHTTAGWSGREDHREQVLREEWREERSQGGHTKGHGRGRGEWVPPFAAVGARGRGTEGHGRARDMHQERERETVAEELRVPGLHKGPSGGRPVEHSEWARSNSGGGSRSVVGTGGRVPEMAPSTYGYRGHHTHPPRPGKQHSRVEKDNVSRQEVEGDRGSDRKMVQIGRPTEMSRTVLVMGLPSGTPTSSVLSVFESQGQVVNARMEDPDFFVTYASPRDAMMAKRRLNRTTIVGKQITVEFDRS